MAINCTNVLVLLWWKSWQRKIFSLRNTMICFLKDASKTDTGTCTSYILKLASRAQSKILCSILSDNKWHWFINFEPLALQFNLYISLKTYTCIMLHEIQQDWFRYRSKNNKRAPTMSSNITVQSFQRIAGCLDTLERIENFIVFFEWLKWMNS